jgi:quercetin dioxygenase-like cupin family protein
MAISVVTPDDWQMQPPSKGRGRHLSMMISAENPSLRLLESAPNCFTPPHSHSEPEVIVVLAGRMMFNGQWCGQGTIVHVPADEDYWFTTGAEHCVVAIMRPKDRGEHHRAAQADAAVDQTS